MRYLLLTLLAAHSALAATFTFNMDTSSLVGSPDAPFSLTFQLTDGSGLDDGNNSVILSSFNFGGGAAAGVPALFGGASGSLGTSVSITDTSFYNALTQGFTPGATLSFFIDITNNVDVGGTPDFFSIAILDNTGAEIATDDPTGFNTLVSAELSGGVTTFQSYGSGGFAAPTVDPTPGSSVPEPNTFLLLLPAAAWILKKKFA